MQGASLGTLDSGSGVNWGGVPVRQLERKRVLKTGETFHEDAADSWVAVAHALARSVTRQLVRARQAA